MNDTENNAKQKGGVGALRSPRLAVHAANVALLRALRRAHAAAEVLRDTATALDPQHLSGCWYVGERARGELETLLDIAEDDEQISWLPEVATVPSRRQRRSRRDDAQRVAA